MLVLWIVKSRLGDSATVEEAAEFLLTEIVRLGYECRAFRRNVDASVQKLTDGEARSVDSLDLLDNLTSITFQRCTCVQ